MNFFEEEIFKDKFLKSKVFNMNNYLFKLILKVYSYVAVL